MATHMAAPTMIEETMVAASGMPRATIKPETLQPICEEAVFSAKSYEERVALEKGLIDLVAGSRDALLETLEGREVRRFDGTTEVLRTAGARFVRSEFSFQHKFMGNCGRGV